MFEAVDAPGRKIARVPRWRLGLAARLAAVLVLLALPFIAATVVAREGFVPPDVITYLGAGERLNVGHPLYSLSAGDRSIADPTWIGSPLLSPPLIAIVFRPIAVLGESGARLWWLTMAVVMHG